MDSEQRVQRSPAAEPPALREYLRPLIGRRWLVLAIVTIATGATFAFYATREKEYTAEVKLFVQSSQIDQALFGTAGAPNDDRNTQNQATLIRSRAVASDAAKRIGFRGDPKALLESVDVVPETGSDFVTVAATAGNPEGAARLANAFSEAFIAVRSAALRNKVTAARETAQDELARLTNAESRRLLQSRIRRLEAIEALPAGAAEEIDKALAPTAPSAPKVARNSLFGFVVSLLVAVALAFGLERFDRRIKRIADVQTSFPFPVLAAVPHVSESEGSNGQSPYGHHFRESFRTLRASLELTAVDRKLKTILVTSAVPGEGKSTVIRNLALAYREAGKRVAVVESDLRRPTLAKLFRLESQPGLTDVLAGRSELSQSLQTVAAEVNGSDRLANDQSSSAPADTVERSEAAVPGQLTVLTSGSKPPNPPAILAAQRVKSVLDEVRSDHDIVLIDSAPLLAVSDAIPLLSSVDAVVIVARLDLTTRDAARRISDLLARIPNLSIAGVVANDYSDYEDRSDYAYYGSYGYSAPS